MFKPVPLTIPARTIAHAAMSTIAIQQIDNILCISYYDSAGGAQEL
jgi:hypothetical protein